MRKKFSIPERGSQVRSQNGKTTILGCRTEFFFCGKKSWSQCFLGWNLLEITVMLQSFHHYFGITVKNRKNRIFHRFFDFTPWSRNNYVMIPTLWQFPGNFTPKTYTSKLNFEKKNFRFPNGVLRFGLKIGKRPIWDVARNFFL